MAPTKRPPSNKTDTPKTRLPSPEDRETGAPSTHEDPSYWEIVRGQFRKRRLAYGSFWAAMGLIALAIYVPLIASNRPFIWCVIDGPNATGWSSPWLSGLFDRNVFESLLDLIFNGLMVAGTPLALAGWVLWRRQRQKPRRERQQAG